MAGRGDATALQWFLRGRWQASLTLAMTFTLAALLPVLAGPLLLLCASLVALVVTQAGRRESLEVLVIAGVATALFTLDPSYALAFGLAAWLPGRLLGEGLLRRQDWSGVAWAALLLALGTLALTLWVIPGAQGEAFWQAQVARATASVVKDLGPVQRQMLGELARLMPALLASAMGLFWVLAALLASRWRDRLLAHPQPERSFRDWTVPGPVLWLFSAAVLSTWAVHGPLLWLAQNLVLLLGSFYLLQGLSLIHLWFAARAWPRAALVAFYVVLVLLSQVLLLTSFLGLLDRIFHLRERISARRS